MGVELMAKLLLRYSLFFFFFFNLTLKAFSGVWDHPGVPKALEGSPLPCMPEGPGPFHFCYENQVSSKRSVGGGTESKNSALGRTPHPPKLLRFNPFTASL